MYSITLLTGTGTVMSRQRWPLNCCKYCSTTSICSNLCDRAGHWETVKSRTLRLCRNNHNHFALSAKEKTCPAGVPCLAVLQPYTVTEPTVESSPQQPTVSPVPPWVVATINMSVTDSRSVVFGDPWELQIVNPYYTELIQVCLLPFDSTSVAMHSHLKLYLPR